MSKKKSKKSNKDKFKKFVSKNRHNILISSILGLIIIGFLLQPVYKDWENARFIKGLARDFPVLVEEIEQATGLELDENISCSITTEKYSEGVRTCELSVGHIGNDISNEVETTVKENEKFALEDVDYSKKIYYKNNNTCSLWYAAEDRFYLRCLTAVREANIDLARELFINNK